MNEPPDIVAAPDWPAFVVLLVDDQVMIADAVRRMIGDEPDVTFHYCSRAGDAVDVARRLKPTVILQDLVMPGLEGLSLLRDYRRDDALKDVPVIVLSAKDEPIVKSAAFSAGASDYLVKLPDQIELIARVRLHCHARVDRLQRDEAYQALRESREQLAASNAHLMTVNRKLEEATHALQVQAMHDSLTGLLNRAAFFEILHQEVARAKRQRTPLTLIMADLDHFKDINDRYGHLTGDVVLREVARRLRAALRTSDVIGRYGGEEFVVAAADCSRGEAAALAERCRLSISGPPIEIPGGSVATTLSCGVASTLDGRESGELLRAADEALYRAKRLGRDRVEIQVFS